LFIYYLLLNWRNIGIFRDYFLSETLAIKADVSTAFHNFGS